MSAEGSTVRPAIGPVKNPGLISLCTDFGIRDPFVGIMKGVILNRCPGAQLVDLTHEIPPQDILSGCLALESAYPYFPPNTVHLAVVDPGVGTARLPLAVRTRRAYFVAPDNGLLSFLDHDDILQIHGIDLERLNVRVSSNTFHGRDVFAPAAALLASGIPIGELGPAQKTLTRIDLPAAHRSSEGWIGEVIGFDHFGNALTTIRIQEAIESMSNSGRVRAGGVEIPLVSTFADQPQGASLALFGSTGRLEICVHCGNAKEVLGLNKGDKILLMVANNLAE